MTAQDAYKELIRDHVAPSVRAPGFKGSGATYHRRVGEDWQIVNFQRSAYSDREEVRFTINLGVGLTSQRGVARLAHDRPPPVHKCHIAERIGFAAGGDKDLWWTLAPSSDLAVVAADVASQLSTTGVVWLDRAHELRRDRGGRCTGRRRCCFSCTAEARDSSGAVVLATLLR